MTMRALWLVVGVASGLQAVDRRRALKAVSPMLAWASLSSRVSAEDFASSLKPLYKAAVFAQKSRRYNPGEARAPPDFEQGLESTFVGEYRDPNHPEGSRTLKLTESKIGEFRIAEITGTDDPASAPFQVPALVFFDQITVDFTAKGGPPGLTGIWSGTGGIKWPDGNKWPKV